MNSRVHQIQNWPELARQADWSVALLARNRPVSVRTLERYFLKSETSSNYEQTDGTV
jgi:transcriptional regulator GlxA family with amidase domain